MATLFKPMDVQVDGNGLSMAGAKLYFYTTGTSTPQDTYSQSDLDPGHVNPNPVVADANGLWPPIYMGETDYKAVLKTSADVTLQTLDPVLVNPAAASLSDEMDSAFGSTEGSLLERSSTAWTAVTFKAVLDRKFGTTQGTLLYRGASDWAALATPAAGAASVLTHAGVGSNPVWQRRACLYATITGGVVTTVKSSGLSIARNSAGKFTCTLNPVMPDATYLMVFATAMSLTAGAGQASSAAEDTAAGTKTTSTFFVITRDDAVGTQDPDALYIEVFG